MKKKQNSLDDLTIGKISPVKKYKTLVIWKCEQMFRRFSEISKISESRNEMDVFDNWQGLGENN